jgi:hypothetical protein
VTVLTAAEVLRQARALIVERGWAPIDGDGQVTIYQAVTLVVLGHAMDGEVIESEAAWATAINGPCRYVDRFVPRPRYAGITHWETTDGRRHDEVLALLDKAILSAELSLCNGAVAA